LQTMDTSPHAVPDPPSADGAATIERVPCPECGTTNAPGRPRCAYCGRALAAATIDPARYARPLWQVGLFTVLSCGLYLFPWATRTARFIDAARGGGGRRGPAVRRALTLLIPLYVFRAIYRLAADVRDIAQVPDGGPDPGLVTWASVAAVLGGRFLPDGWALLAVPALLAVVLPVQRRINDHCERLDAGVTERRRLRARDYLGLAVGTVVTASVLFLNVAPATALRLTGQLPTTTGPAAIAFGHHADDTTGRLTDAAAVFRPRDHIAWVVHLSAPIGASSLLRTIDQRGAVGGALQRVSTTTVPVSDATLYSFYEDNDLTALGQDEPLTPGRYLLRYWRDGTVIAQGTFTVGG